MMLPNLPFLNWRGTKRDLLLYTVIAVTVAFAFYACVSIVQTFNGLDELKEALQKQADFENCVGPYTTQACLDYRKAKLVLDQEYHTKLNVLRAQRTEAEHAGANSKGH
jgi:hypothetical protein